MQGINNSVPLTYDMFFDGDLQAGIALALHESKCIVCFVKDTGAQSTVWEDEYLQDDEVTEQLRRKAVVLRIQEGSEEAGFLAAFCPLSISPTLVVINDGELRGHLQAGLSAEQFKKSLLEALRNSIPATPNTPEADSSTVSRTIYPNPLGSSQDDFPPGNPDVRAMLEERRKRLEADKKKKDAAEKAESIAKAKARRAEVEDIAPDSPQLNQVKYAQQQRKRQQEARQERERILKVIENDRLERKYREELRKTLAKAVVDGEDGADGLVDAQLSKEVNASRPSTSKESAVQIRLFDGSTIRSRFLFDQTLRTHIRQWVDKQRSDGDSPYTFIHILAPMPNRPITISEEEESLQSLGLIPSATLIMVPVQSYTAAYTSQAGLLSRGLSAGYNVISGGVGLASGVLQTFMGLGQDRGSAAHEDRPEQQSTHGAEPVNPRSSGPGINIRTLRDQRPNWEDQQFYNGNQLNFEPRDDDEKRD